MTIASLIWGNYGRFVANPVVCAVISIVVLAVNIGLIIGSEMWNVPLATDISKLWIDPASEVAANNKLIDTYGSKVTETNNELFTLQYRDGSNMMTEAGLTLWEDLSTRILDTVICYKETAYTVLDVCNGRNGQVPYSFGCLWNSPLDYFNEGKVFFPSDAVAQWLLDQKLAWRFAIPVPQTEPYKFVLWEWAINADSASAINPNPQHRNKVQVYSTWFTKRCLVSKKLFCGDINAIYDQIEDLIDTLNFPGAAKMNFIWIRAQLALSGLIAAATTNTTTPPNPSPQSTCAGGPFDMQTTTNTDRITFTDPLVVGALAFKGFQNGLNHSFANCAADTTTNLNIPLPCGGAQVTTCNFNALGLVEPLDFSSDCASCIMAMAWWTGDLKKIQSNLGPATLPLAPPSGIWTVPTFQGMATSSTVLKAVIVGTATGLKSLIQSTVCVDETIVPPSNCTYLWDEFHDSTIAGLNGSVDVPKTSAHNRALVLAKLPIRAEDEIVQFIPGGRTAIDALWREMLLDDTIPDLRDALNRFALSLRPSYKSKTPAEIARTLSGFRNDLLTQNLRPAVFGGATPNARNIRAGRCVCDATWAGSKCTVKQDNICECDASLNEACVGALLGSCFSLASCASFETITGLVLGAQLGQIHVPAEAAGLLAQYSNFENEMTAAAGFQNATTQTNSAKILLEHCSQFLPCVDQLDVTTDPILSALVPSTFQGVINDATWNLFLVQDLSTLAVAPTNPEAWLAGRGTFLMKFVVTCLLDTSCSLGTINTVIGSVVGYTLVSNDITAMAGCFGITGNFDACLHTNTTVSTELTSTSMSGSCPTLLGYIASEVTHLTFGHYFECYVFNQQPPTFTARRGSGSQTLWPITASVGKSNACSAATVTSPIHLTRENCTYAVASFLVQGVVKVYSGFAAASSSLTPLLLPNAFGASDATTLPSAEQVSTLGLSFAHILGANTHFVDQIKALFGATFGCTSPQKYSTCFALKTTIDSTLKTSCLLAKADFTPVALEAEGCDAVFTYVAPSLQGNQAAIAAVAMKLAKYKLMGTLFGACSSTGGSANGGGECWADADCGTHGSCNLTDIQPLENVRVFATIAFTNSPEGTMSNMNASDGQYRERANAPILERWKTRVGADAATCRAGTPNWYGVRGPVKNLTTEDAKEIISNFRLAMIDAVSEFREAQPSTQADIYTADSATDLLNEISEADPKILVLGYGLMLLYAFLSCTNWSTDVPAMLNGSRAFVAQAGIILVAISVASGLGVSHLAGVEWSAAATQIVPFVMLGLGVSDTFVLLRIFPYYQDGLSPAEASAKAMTIAGPPMLLVSATNAGVFAMGVLTAMPVVVNFALQAVIVVVANYFTTNLMLPALMVLDYKRMAAGRMDMAPCVHVGTSARAQVQSETSQYEHNVFNKFLTPCYSKCLLSIPGKIFVILLSLSFLGSAVYGVDRVAELGLQLSDVAPSGSDLSQALVTRDTYIGFYTVNIVTGETDWSERVNQQGLPVLFAKMMALDKVVDGSGTSWMEVFMSWGQVKTPLYDPYATGQLCNSQSPRTEGQCGDALGCTVVTEDLSVIAGGLPFYAKADFYPCLEKWINHDLAYEALKPGFDLEDPFAPRGSRVLKPSKIDEQGNKYLPYTTGTLVTQGLSVNQDFVDLINEARAVANSATTPPSFPAGEPIDFWDQYVYLSAIINKAVGFGLLICFVTIFILLLVLVEGDSSFIKRLFATFWASALTTGIIALTVYEIYGFMAYAGLKISAIPAISIIMSTGVAVEYTAYIAVSFVNGVGTGNERSTHALMLMLAPVIDGAVTMFLGVVMLAASPFVFIVKYFFYPWLLIIFFGMFNGIAFLPVVFSLVGPPAVMSAAGKKTVDSQVANKM